jgi:UDP-N-acetylmuramoylalanine--D-glutamate ligase
MNFETLAQHSISTQHETMAASVAQRIYELRKKSLLGSFSGFRNEEHRMEPVAYVKGIEFINDSKATNVNATWYALEQMTKPVVWIVGGQDSKNDYKALKPLVQKHVKEIVCLGTDNTKIYREFSSIVPSIVQTFSAKEAVEMAYNLAESGDTVLFSPAAPSFDLFESYEDRGNQFKNAVNEL